MKNNGFFATDEHRLTQTKIYVFVEAKPKKKNYQPQGRDRVLC